MHFFSPAHIMPLVECVRGQDTTPATIAAVMGVTKTIKKVFVQGKGLLLSRVLIYSKVYNGHHASRRCPCYSQSTAYDWLI